jgi:hypothetical protein
MFYYVTQQQHRDAIVGGFNDIAFPHDLTSRAVFATA